MDAASIVNARRESLSLTVNDLCEAVGDPGGQVTKWLNGSRGTCPFHLRIRVADQLRISLSSVLDDEELELARLIARNLRREQRNGAAA